MLSNFVESSAVLDLIKTKVIRVFMQLQVSDSPKFACFILSTTWRQQQTWED